MENFKNNFIEFKNSLDSFRNIVARAPNGEMGIAMSQESFKKGLEKEFINILHRQGMLSVLLQQYPASEIPTLIRPSISDYWDTIKEKLIISRDNLLRENSDKSIIYAVDWLDSVNNPYRNTQISDILKNSLLALVHEPDGELIKFKRWDNDIIGSVQNMNTYTYDRVFDIFDLYLSLPAIPPPILTTNNVAAAAAGIVRKKSHRKKSHRKKSHRKKSHRKKSTRKKSTRKKS